jgi:UDP-N-acetylmuramoyl-L-alanyl-D-glutamate--2,6-diaminopimelate ligase
MEKPVSNLAALAKEFGCTLSGDGTFTPAGVAIGSGFVEKDFLFIATGGAKAHGLDFLEAAVTRGARALLTNREGDYFLPTLVHPNPREIAGKLASRIFATPQDGLLAVTGTNGKTSTVYYLQRLLKALGQNCGLISSAGQIVAGRSFSSELTTPEAPRLHQLLAKMRSAGEQRGAIEVSAQALVRNRVDGLRFEVAGFSNLSRDHLDDFDSMENYLSAKANLFTEQFSDKAVINVEDDWGKKLFSQIAIPKVGIGNGLDYQYRLENRRLKVSGRHSLEIVFAQGELMAKNFVLACVMLLETGIESSALEKAASLIDQQVPGRLQLVSDQLPQFFVDYAHTPEGVRAAVQEILRRNQDLTVILGASGNRDQGKRVEMAIALKGANRIIITDQHPRDEDPQSIRATLMSAARTLDAELIEIADAAEVAKAAVRITPKTGAILWCGPGQLTYREIKGAKVPFSAIDSARLAVENA